MDFWDYLVLGAAVAGLLWAISSTFLQRKWRFYDVFIGEKHGFKAHVSLMTIVSIQLIVVTVLDMLHHWRLSWFLPLGAVIVAAAVWLFVKSVQEGGVKSLFHGAFFRRSEKKKGQLWDLFIEPVFVSYVLFYVGLALLTTHLAHFFAALVLMVGLGALALLVPRAPK